MISYASGKTTSVRSGSVTVASNFTNAASSLLSFASSVISTANGIASGRSGGTSYSCGGSSSGGSSGSISGSGSTTKTTKTQTTKSMVTSKTFTSLSQIGTSGGTSKDKLKGLVTDEKTVMKKDGKMYIGDEQIYLKSENGKYYIVDKNGNYVHNTNGSKKVITPSNLNESSLKKITNYANTGSIYGDSKKDVKSEPVTTTTSNNKKEPSGKGLVSDEGAVFKQDGKMYIGDEQVYLKKEDGKYYIVDKDGNYVHKTTGKKRTLDVSKASGEVLQKVDNYEKYNSTYGNVKSTIKTGSNGVYTTVIKDSNNNQVGTVGYIGSNDYEVVDSNYKNKDGKDCVRIKYRNALGGYDEALILKENYSRFQAQANVIGNLESSGYDFGSISQNIRKITDTEIIFTNGAKVDVNSNSSLIYALAQGGSGLKSTDFYGTGLWEDGQNKGTTFYDLHSSTGKRVDGLVLDLSGSNNEQKTWDFLMQKGYTEEQAAGIMGNLMQESQFVTSSDNGSHHGIVQWDYYDRWSLCKSFCYSNNLDPNTLVGQLNFMDWELKNRYTSTYNQIVNSNSVLSVTDTFRSEYEVCGHAKDTRRKNAADIYDTYGV